MAADAMRHSASRDHRQAMASNGSRRSAICERCQLRAMGPGDCVLLRPPPSKSDQFGTVWGASPIYLAGGARSAATQQERSPAQQQQQQPGHSRGDRNRIWQSNVVRTRTHLGHLSDPAEIVGFGCTIWRFTIACKSPADAESLKPLDLRLPRMHDACCWLLLLHGHPAAVAAVVVVTTKIWLRMTHSQ